MIEKRYKNPYFWTGLIGIMIAASGIDVTMLTDWPAVGQAIVDVVMNPLAIVAVGMAALGVFVNPTTKGIKD